MSSLPEEEGEELKESETEEELEEDPPASQFNSYNSDNGTTAAISCVKYNEIYEAFLKAQIFSIITKSPKKRSHYLLLPETAICQTQPVKNRYSRCHIRIRNL